jgi:protein-S-isoprenylcysteine O-methyltransferase Ste14
MDNNNNEHKKGQYHEAIDFATQQMSENAQFSVAIAVGIFGILAIFVSLDTHNVERLKDPLWSNALWTQPPWIRFTGIVLSIAYWALVLFGIQTYVTRRLFEGILGKYHKKNEWRMA